jgi:uncharacterized protein (TIGR02996 family)
MTTQRVELLQAVRGDQQAVLDGFQEADWWTPISLAALKDYLEAITAAPVSIRGRLLKFIRELVAVAGEFPQLVDGVSAGSGFRTALEQWLNATGADPWLPKDAVYCCTVCRAAEILDRLPRRSVVDETLAGLWGLCTCDNPTRAGDMMELLVSLEPVNDVWGLSSVLAEGLSSDEPNRRWLSLAVALCLPKVLPSIFGWSSTGLHSEKGLARSENEPEANASVEQRQAWSVLAGRPLGNELAGSMDEMCFLNIWNNPDDPSLELFYADWLAEHGFSDRAAFIRLGRQLAAMPRQAPQQQELEARYTQAMSSIAPAWTALWQQLPERQKS